MSCYGDARGDELPPELSTQAGRREWLARELERERAASGTAAEATARQDKPDRSDSHEFDAERIVARVQGREGWLREAKRQLDQDRWLEAAPVPAVAVGAAAGGRAASGGRTCR